MPEGDFELALRGLLGEVAPLSKSTVRRLRERWVAEHAEWEGRSLADREVVYVWADGIYVKAGLEKDKAALPVVIGALAGGTKEVLAVVPGYRESAESWAAVLRDLRARGLGVPNLLVADSHVGIWAAARQVWPEAAKQRCWNHRMVNVLDRLPEREQKEAREMLRKVAYAESRGDAEKAREAFAGRYAATHPKAVETLADDWERLVSFFDFPRQHWRHLRTTNVVESPFAAVQLRTNAAKRFWRVEGATPLIWKRRRRDAVVEGPQGGQQAASGRLAAKQLKVDLARMRRQLRGDPEEPEPEPLGLRRPPGTGEVVFAKRVQRLVGHDGEAPQQGVAVEIVHGRPAGRQLGQFLDPLLDHGALVVEAPGGQGVDAFDVGQHVRLAQDLVRIDAQHAFVADGPRGLNREQACAPQRARRRPHVLARKDRFALGREAPMAAVGLQPAVARNLESAPSSG